MGTKLALNEAAAQMGITLDVARNRIKRGQLQAEKIGNRWYVDTDYLAVDQSATRSAPNGTHESASQHHEATSPSWQAFVDSLQAEVTFLKQELDNRTEELRRKDHIIAGLVERVPALPSETEAVKPTESSAAHTQTLPWWKRLFGLP